MKKTVKKRAFVSAVAMLIVSAIVLTSSTFAWFTMSKQATVEQMDLTVSSPEGILISANAKAWSATLTPEQIFATDTSNRMNAYEGHHNLLPTAILPASCAFYRASNGYPQFFVGTVNDAGQISFRQINQETTTADNAGFVAFDLFVKLLEPQNVYFGTSSFVDNSNQDALTALRVGFQNMGTFRADADPATVTSTTALGNTTMYEVDSINRSGDAQSAGLSTGALDTKYVHAVFTTTVDDNAIATHQNAVMNTATTLVRSNASASQKALSLNAGITKLRVYIWMEGNDVDCRNSVGGASLSVTLKFTID